MADQDCNNITLFTSTSKLSRSLEENHYAMFQSLRWKHDLSDFTITCGGREFKAHRAILAMKCRYFTRMFRYGYVEFVNNRVELHEDDPSLVADMVKYIYADTAFHITLHGNHLEKTLHLIHFWLLGDKYEVDGLTSAIEEHLQSCFDSEEGDWTVQELLQVIDTVYEYSLAPASRLRVLLIHYLFHRAETRSTVQMLRDEAMYDELRKRPEFMLDMSIRGFEAHETFHALRDTLRSLEEKAERWDKDSRPS